MKEPSQTNVTPAAEVVASTSSVNNRELDAQIAVELFGWKWFTLRLVAGGIAYTRQALRPPDFRGGTPCAPPEKIRRYHYNTVPAYSSTWEGAGLVIEEMERKGCLFGLYPEVKEVVFVWRDAKHRRCWDIAVYDPSKPETRFVAICSAALAAVRAGKDEVKG